MSSPVVSGIVARYLLKKIIYMTFNSLSRRKAAPRISGMIVYTRIDDALGKKNLPPPGFLQNI
jgi:hypothetical protein